MNKSKNIILMNFSRSLKFLLEKPTCIIANDKQYDIDKKEYHYCDASLCIW